MVSYSASERLNLDLGFIERINWFYLARASEDIYLLLKIILAKILLFPSRRDERITLNRPNYCLPTKQSEI